ncbi:TSUP family transporter, partial [Azospirillum sp. B506]|uniref:TSUP family transporter n=1 Tax=Azospirillum sp. B506 TaxID=137721 RepID=UPI0005B256F0
TARRGKLHRHIWLHGLPFKMRFQRSKLYISALLPAGIGAVGGMLVAIMGIGGGFLLVPAMIYLLNMPAGLVAPPERRWAMPPKSPAWGGSSPAVRASPSGR